MRIDYSLLSKKYGSEFDRLDDSQKKELLKILYRTVDDHMERSMFVAGGHTLRELDEKTGNTILYGGIRGSIARAEATEKDDVDLLIATPFPEDARQILKEIVPKYGKALKLMVPKMQRGEERLITYILMDKNKYRLFVEDPILLDMKELDFHRQRQVEKGSMTIKKAAERIQHTGIMNDLEANPFEFVETHLKPLSNGNMPLEVIRNLGNMHEVRKSKISEKANKLVSHALVYTVGRLVGIQLYGEELPHRHVIVRLRDRFLKEFLGCSVSPC